MSRASIFRHITNSVHITRESTEIIANAELGLLTILRITINANRWETAEIPNRLPYWDLERVVDIDFHTSQRYI